MTEKWVTFKFDGNLAWGIVSTKKYWLKIKEMYNGSGVDIDNARRCNYTTMPSFGFGIEFRGSERLKDFMKKNGM